MDSYKEWLKQNKNLYSKSPETFNLIHSKKWGENIGLPEHKEYKNSGSKEILLDNIKELRAEIDKLTIKNVEEKDRSKFEEHIKNSSLSKKDDKEILSPIIRKYKKVLLKIHELKMEIIKCLLTTYINKNNDGCNVDILKKIGFRACSCCHK